MTYKLVQKAEPPYRTEDVVWSEHDTFAAAYLAKQEAHRISSSTFEIVQD